MNPKLYRIILPVPDIEKAEKFYAQTLEQPGIRVSPGRHYFNLGGTILACYDPGADGDEPGTWQFHENQFIYISVPNLQSVQNDMKKLDCQSIGEIREMPWGETLFYAKDPFGNPLCFVDERTVFLGDE